MTITDKVEQLAHLQSELKMLKEKEMALRLEIHSEVNKGRGPGTYRDDFGSLRLKTVVRYNYTFDKEALEENWNQLSEEEKECVRWKPELNKRQYDKLEMDESEILNDLLIIKPGTPTITVEDNYE